MFDAVLFKDFQVVQGVTVFLAAFVLAINLVASPPLMLLFLQTEGLAQLDAVHLGGQVIGIDERRGRRVGRSEAKRAAARPAHGASA